MQIFNGVEHFSAKNEKIILALGNFDGVHLGHHQIIKKTVFLAREKQLKSAAMVFSPHPLVLLKKKTVPLLTSFNERNRLLSCLGLDYLIVEPFTVNLSHLTPSSFVKHYFLEMLKIDSIVVGFDYSYGKNGAGSADDLKDIGQIYGFNTFKHDPVIINGEIVSSSLIRRLIGEGKVAEAAKYLNYYFRRQGKIIKGDERGRTLGYPTANFFFDKVLLIPGSSVYLTAVLYKNKHFFGLTNVGDRPTFGKNEASVETYIFNFCENLYGQELILLFLQKIREETFFPNSSDLKKQIAYDVKVAQSLIKEHYEKNFNTNFFVKP